MCSFRKGFASRDAEETLQNSFSHLRELSIKAHNPNGEKDYSGIIELTTSLLNNLGFSKNDRKNKGMKYTPKLIEGIDSFKEKKYSLTNDITIKLSPKSFVHILIGHVENYSIPRKGRLIQFTNINHWEDLLLFIDALIVHLQKDLIMHYSNSRLEYNNINVKIGTRRYGIHISKSGNIKTIYQMPHSEK